VKKLFIFAIAFFMALASCRSKKQATHGLSNRDKAERKTYFENKYGVAFDRETNHKLYMAIDVWYGTPHKLGACEKSGIDCSCFVNRVFKEVYDCDTPRDTKGLMEAIKQIDREKLREGDLVFFAMNKGSKVDHVGIYLSSGKFVHTSSKRGVMVSSLDEPHFEKAFKISGRLKCSG
jgi:cell wall-associated NlpC family hydrolase